MITIGITRSERVKLRDISMHVEKRKSCFKSNGNIFYKLFLIRKYAEEEKCSLLLILYSIILPHFKCILFTEIDTLLDLENSRKYTENECKNLPRHSSDLKIITCIVFCERQAWTLQNFTQNVNKHTKTENYSRSVEVTGCRKKIQ